MITNHPFKSNQRELLPDQFISPELAEYLLNYNSKNRLKNGAHIENLAADIREGYWYEKGMAMLGFRHDGVIVNGQHTLEAIVLAGKGIHIHVATGLEEEAVKYCDSGASRSPAVRHALRYSRVLDRAAFRMANAKVAVAKLWMRIVNDYAHERISDRNLYSFLNRYGRAINKVCVKIPAKFKRAGFRTAVAQYFHNHPEKAQTFFDAVVNGDNLAKGSPCLVLRDHLFKKASVGGTQGQAEDYKETLYCIHAFHKNKKVNKIEPLEYWDFAS